MSGSTTLLKDCYLFQNLDEQELNCFANESEIKSYKKGEPIFLESELSHHIYFVLSGEVQIVLNHRTAEGQVVRTLTKGEHLSELSVLTNARHSASAFAGCDTELLEIDGNRFVEILQANNEITISLTKTLAGVLVKNLKETHAIRPLTDKKIHFNAQFQQAFPVGLLKKYKAVPLKLIKGTLHVGMVLPLQQEFFKEYQKLGSGYNLQISTINAVDFDKLQQDFLSFYAGFQQSKSEKTNTSTASLEELLPFSLMFSQLTKHVLDQIEPHFKKMPYKSGDVIISAGEKFKHLYLVGSGKIELSKTLPKEKLRLHVETASSSDFFGEASLLLGSESPVDAIAIEDGELFVLPKPVFDELLRTINFSLPLCMNMAFRLQTLNKLPGLDLELAASPTDKVAPSTVVPFKQKSDKTKKSYPLGKLPTGSIDKLLDEILFASAKLRASDIHMEFLEAQAIIRCRVDGAIIQPWEGFKPETGSQLVNRIKILSGLDIAEKRRPQDGQIEQTTSGEVFNGRVSTIPTKYGEKVVIRILSKQGTLIPLNRLAPHKGVINFLNEIKNFKQGLFLVAGPTGSGKTTSLYSILNEVNSEKSNIVTIEDPIELDLHGANQTQVNSGIGLTYKTILKSVLRQDPDIILVGEIRDEESLQLVFEAALTGHLVLSTIHAPNSIQILHRMLELGASPAQISSSLIGVMSQRLVRKVCEHCRSKRAMNETEQEYLPSLSNTSFQIIYGQGCEKCNHTGFHQRIPIYEYWKNTPEISDAILHEKDIQVFKSILRKYNFQSLGDFALEMVKNGLTTVEEAQSALFGLFEDTSGEAEEDGANKSA